ncbi:MAG: YggS family pyridoxal phosphate-dependent enzyme [Oscillospiraceae bacterium]|nr:YggS family pyridoxal phosphate-dependent enzyme [Oscillospiraceae bacterium]
MENSFDYITENYKRICNNIEEAKAKYRTPSDVVSFMAVTKTVAPEAINHAIHCGISLLGENRVQEYLSKREFYDPSATVHFIGHLQTNKVKYIIEDMALIHSVDSVHLAKEIDRQAARVGKIQDILLEVNIGEENSKSGVAPKQLLPLLQEIASYPHLHVKGLMTIPPAGENEKFLSKMQDLYLDIRSKNVDNIDMDILSMGMSDDYVKAIQYGATLVRIGSALFGARVYK